MSKNKNEVPIKKIEQEIIKYIQGHISEYADPVLTSGKQLQQLQNPRFRAHANANIAKEVRMWSKEKKMTIYKSIKTINKAPQCGNTTRQK